MPPKDPSVTTGRFITTVAAIVALIFFGLASLVGLEIAGRPVGTIMELELSTIAPTIVGLLALLKIQNLAHDVRNGVGDTIAQKAAEHVLATTSTTPPVVGGKRATDPPAGTIPTDPTPHQEGAA